MKLVLPILILSTLIYSLSACNIKETSTSDIFSGVQEGNGGDAVVCKASDGTIVSVKSFDLSEAQLLRGILPDLGAIDIDPVKKLEFALNRFARLDPERAGRYLQKAKTFVNDSRLVPGYVLLDIPDSNHIGLEDGCQLEQLVAYIPPRFPQDKPYIINEDLWKRLDNDNKAAVILHEIVYRELKILGATNSSEARYLNSMILSNLIDGYTVAAYIDLLKIIDPTGKLKFACKQFPEARIGLYVVDGNGIELSLPTVTVVDYGPHQLQVDKIKFNDQLELDLDSPIDTDLGVLKVLGSQCKISHESVEFFPNTTVPSGNYHCDINFDLNGQGLTASMISLGSNGKLEKAYVKNYSPFKVAGDRVFSIVSLYDPPMKLPNEKITSHYTTFHPNGMLKNATFDSRSSNTCFIKASGQDLCLPSKYLQYDVSFDEQGYITDAK
jgi:hypothetical protein